MPMYVKMIIAIVAAFILSFAATPLVKRFAHRVGAIDVPRDSRRIHKKPVPRLGGLAIFIGFLLSVLIFADITAQVRGILLGAVIIVILGVIDDIIQLRAYIKFLVQIAAASVAVLHGILLETFVNPFVFGSVEYVHLGYLAIPITIIWIVGITNSVNLIDGLDGLAVGVSAISSTVMLIIALIVAEMNVAIIIAALAGACIGFMPYNLNPAKIFMGDTGALLLGYVLATISILGLFKFYAVLSLAVPFLVLALPLVDTVFAFFRRLIKGKNPMSPDRGHFHHRLIDMGLSQKQAVAILYAVSGLFGLIAVVLITSEGLRLLVFIFAVLIAALIAFFTFRGIRSNTAANDSEPETPADETVDEPADEPADELSDEPEKPEE